MIYRLLVSFEFGGAYTVQIVKNGKFAGHYFIHYFFFYTTVFIISLSIILHMKKLKNKNKIEIEERVNSINLIKSEGLIYNNVYEFAARKNPWIIILFIIILYVIVEQALTIFKIYFKNCDFWMIELYILAWLNAKMFKIKVYKQHLLVILIDIIPILLKGVILALTFFDEKNHWDNNNHDNYKYDISNPNNTKLKSLLVLYWPLVPVALLLYLGIATLRSYIMINFKKFMDLKHISIWKILALYGFIGGVFCSLFSLGTTFLPCGENLKIPNKKDINDYQCTAKDDKYK